MPRNPTLRHASHRTTRARHAAALARAIGAAMEPLESRRLLSATLDGGGTLLVTGTEGDDDIFVERVEGAMRVDEDGRTTDFNAAAVRRVEIRALGGNDRASIARAGVPGTLIGGAGEDFLTGGAQNDVLRGEAGNDQLDGGRGGDDLSGGDGVDRLSYGTRTARVVVGLGTFADDGEIAERDNARNDIENVFGGSGNDELKGDDDRNFLFGGLGNDRLIGNGGNDTLEGREGNDTFLGGAGNDDLHGNAGADDMSGGAGNDTVNYSRHSATGVTVGLGRFADDGEPGEGDNARDDNENVIGSPGRDIIKGTSAPNALDGAAGNDELYGRGGNDRLRGGSGRDALHGDGGDDLLQGRDGEADFLAGGFGTDTAEADAIDTLNGVEQGGPPPQPGATLGADGTLRVNGTASNDHIFVGPEPGNIMRVGFNDQQTDFEATRVRRIEINGLGGDDHLDIGNTATPGTILGGSGDDRLSGGQGNDSLRGEDGEDHLDGSGGGDDMSGGAGVDTLDYSLRTGNLTVGLGTFPDDGEAGERDNARNDIENVISGTGNDTVKGTAAANGFSDFGGNDTFHGFGGNDQFLPAAGNDRVFGGDGNDLVISAREGDGADDYSGGAGVDTLDYSGRSGNLRIGLGTFADDGVIGEGDNARSDFENVIGGRGNDKLFGTSAINFLDGWPGDDELYGRGGNDTLVGSEGRDALHGEGGNDVLRGRDGFADFLAGGFGTDTAEADDIDILNGVERRA